MPIKTSDKCRQCSKLSVETAISRHGEQGDDCWAGELCHKRRIYHKERDLYTGDIELKQAIQAVGQGRWQDVPPDLNSSAFA